MRQIIMPSDVVLHRPTGETWTVCGKCALAGVCSGPEALESNCIIDKETECVAADAEETEGEAE